MLGARAVELGYVVAVLGVGVSFGWGGERGGGGEVYA